MIAPPRPAAADSGQGSSCQAFARTVCVHQRPTRRRLLIVDDEQMILRSLARALGQQYDVTTLALPTEALLRIAAGEEWDVILSDVTMPVMDGLELVRRIVVARPDLARRIVLMSGCAPTRERSAALETMGVQLIRKPVELTVLRAVLAECT